MPLELTDSSRARAGATSVNRLDIAMLVANALGVLIYLWRAHYGWAIPEERAAGIDAVTGEPFIWALGVFPVWIVFLVANVAWAVAILLRMPPKRLLPFALISVLWVVAVIVDFAHH